MNTIGLKTLFLKETRRFLKVPAQTIAQPVVTTGLYFVIFGSALGGRLRNIEGVPYVRFIIPGLVMLALIQNSFLNTSSSMFVAKLQGTVVDLLMAPLTAGEMLVAYASAATLRALIVGTITWLVASAFTGFAFLHPLWVLCFSVVVSATFGLLGLVVAIWADKFEELNIVPTFVVMPLTFLGGVFYSVRMLPEPWQTVTRANPILYMVEGLRYGMLGVCSSSPWTGLGIVLVLFAAALSIAYWMLQSGYKLRN